MKLRLTHNPEYANFIPRAIAFGIDELLWSIPVFWAVSRWAQLSTLETLGSQMLQDVVYVFIPLAAVQTIVNLVLVSKYGITLGKLATGLTIVDQKTKKTIGLWNTILREMIAKPANSLFAGLSYLLVLVDAKHQALHDKAAGTVVTAGSKQRTFVGAAVLVSLAILLTFWTVQITMSAQKTLPALIEEGTTLLHIE